MKHIFLILKLLVLSLISIFVFKKLKIRQETNCLNEKIEADKKILDNLKLKKELVKNEISKEPISSILLRIVNRINK